MHSLLKPRTKNPDSPRTPQQILEFPNQNQEARTKIPQRLLSKSWFLVLGFKSKIPQKQEPRTKIPQRLLSKSWFLVLNLRFPKSKLTGNHPYLANYFRLAKYMLIMLQPTQIDAIMYKIQRWRMKIRESVLEGSTSLQLFERGRRSLV